MAQQPEEQAEYVALPRQPQKAKPEPILYEPITTDTIAPGEVAPKILNSLKEVVIKEDEDKIHNMRLGKITPKGARKQLSAANDATKPPLSMSSASDGGTPTSHPETPRSQLTPIELSEPQPSAIRISNIKGYCEFLNGQFLLQEAVMHNNRLTFRTQEPLDDDAGAVSGEYMYLYHHRKNKAWVFGLKITDSSGVAGFRKGSEQLPSNFSSKNWYFSDVNGKFVPCENVTVEAVYGGPIITEKAQKSPDPSWVKNAEVTGLLQPQGTSRNQAQELLKKEYKKNKCAGAFVFRQSTSTPNAYVLSVLTDKKTIEHNLIKGSSQGFTIHDQTFDTLRELIEYYERHPLIIEDEHGDEFAKVLLTKCIQGAGIYMHIESSHATRA